MSRLKRYQNPDLYERLAAEYVLGSLKGRARRRFEKLIRQRPYIRYAVDIWEEKLNSMVEQLPGEKPPARVWQAIQKEIKAGQEEAGKLPFWQRLGFWQFGTALVSVLLLAVLVQPYWVGQQQMRMPSYVAVLESEAEVPMMVTMGDKKNRLVTVRLMEKPKLQPDTRLQLWAFHGHDHKPVPMGVVSTDQMETHIRFTGADWQRFEGAEMFGVSREPMSGSYSEPTGPMMYKGACIDFI